MKKHSGHPTRAIALVATLIACAIGIVLMSPPGSTSASPPNAPRVNVYKLMGWNDLGMHCMNESFANLAVLPPYNTLWSQLILQAPQPQIITTAITVEYNVLDNTYSACQSGRCKSNFWQYAQALFGLAAPLPDNVGLAGATLSGTMNARADHLVIEGVPVTPYRDSAPSFTPANWYPYQQVQMTAKNSGTGQILAQTLTVAPVSTEMRCENCHSDGQRNGIATGNVETNILTLHDQEASTTLMNSRPVLCANCHASNALGKPGLPGLSNLSLAMHGQHASVTNNCYNCHPGVVTQCLRDVMWSKGITCANCHGGMSQVADSNRNPWVDLPRCEICHASQYAVNLGKRYRDSTGHGGMYCEACHGSPHAILPTSQWNDNIQSFSLQGFTGTVRDCRVCHGTLPTQSGPHSIRAMVPSVYFPLIRR